MTLEDIEQLANERYPTAKDSLTKMAERKGWIAGFKAGMQSVIDNITDLNSLGAHVIKPKLKVKTE